MTLICHVDGYGSIVFKLLNATEIIFLTTPLFSAECPAGSYKADDMNECGVCPHNTVSTGGAALCTPCEAGKEPNYERTECGKNCF